MRTETQRRCLYNVVRGSLFEKETFDFKFETLACRDVVLGKEPAKRKSAWRVLEVEGKERGSGVRERTERGAQET